MFKSFLIDLHAIFGENKTKIISRIIQTEVFIVEQYFYFVFVNKMLSIIYNADKLERKNVYSLNSNKCSCSHIYVNKYTVC